MTDVKVPDKNKTQCFTNSHRMKLLHILLLIISAKYLFVTSMQGGRFVSIKSVPYMAQLYYHNHTRDNYVSTYCGATIISEHWLVTAAHCLRSVSKYIYHEVRTGSSLTAENGKLVNITDFVVNGNYDPDNGWDGDIALVKVEKPIEFNEYQYPIKFSRVSPKPGDVISVAGFGYMHFYIPGTSLREAKVTIIDNATCQKGIKIVTNNMLCSSVKEVDLCYGDSGGPAVFDGKLVGVISQGCEYTLPNVYTKVANYFEWISNTTGIKYSDDSTI